MPITTKNLELYYLHRPVADLTSLKAIDTTSIVDGEVVQIKSLGFFKFDKTSSETSNDRDIITPTTGGGRWKRETLPFMETDATGTKIAASYVDIPNPLLFKGTINVAADFPTLAAVQPGWFYIIGTNVTDNDPTKTNTGLSFLAGDEIAWTGSTWDNIGSSALWLDDGSNLKPSNSSRGVDIPGSGNKLYLGTQTDLATPGITLITRNSGYAAPSNVGATSVGDKWVFWNGTGVYKGAIGFNAREMWFQSTDVGAAANRFKWFGGSAGTPVELLNIGDLGFVWNDARSDIDFSIRKATSGDAYTYDFGAESHQFTGTFTLSSLTAGITTTNGSGLVGLSHAVTDSYTPTLGQTIFTLSQTRNIQFHFILTLNGQVREETADFTVSGTTLTWLDPAGLTLKTTDRLIARYYY